VRRLRPSNVSVLRLLPALRAAAAGALRGVRRDEAVVALDRPRQCLEERVLERPDLLRIEPLRQRREAGEVGEEDGDLPPVSFARRRLLGFWESTSGSEPGAGAGVGVRVAPRGTPQRGQYAKSGSHGAKNSWATP